MLKLRLYIKHFKLKIPIDVPVCSDQNQKTKKKKNKILTDGLDTKQISLTSFHRHCQIIKSIL